VRAFQRSVAGHRPGWPGHGGAWGESRAVVIERVPAAGDGLSSEPNVRRRDVPVDAHDKI